MRGKRYGLAIGLAVLLVGGALALRQSAAPVVVEATPQRPAPKARRVVRSALPAPAPEPPAPETERVEAPTAPVGSPIYGLVRGAEKLPEGAVFVEGCGLRGRDAPVDEDGRFFAELSSEPCRLRAWRANGALRLPGPWVEVVPKPGVDVDVALTVPTFEPAGMGVGFQPVGDGVVVTTVHPGTPAMEASLEAGDLITAIDGAPTAGMETEEFLRHGVGPSGTEVVLEGITREGEPFEATLVRRPFRID